MSNATQPIELTNRLTNRGTIKMIRYHVLIIIIILLIVGFLFMVGKFGSDGLAFFIFIIFLSVPVLVMYRNQLPEYIPAPLRDFVRDKDHETGGVRRNVTVSKIIKQMFCIVCIILLLIGCVILILNIRPDLAMDVKHEVSIENDTFTKIITGVMCTTIAGILIIKLSEI